MKIRWFLLLALVACGVSPTGLEDARLMKSPILETDYIAMLGSVDQADHQASAIPLDTPKGIALDTGKWLLWVETDGVSGAGRSNYVQLWIKPCNLLECAPLFVTTQNTGVSTIWQAMIGDEDSPMTWPQTRVEHMYHGIGWTLDLKRETYVLKFRAYHDGGWQPWSNTITIMVQPCGREHLPNFHQDP